MFLVHSAFVSTVFQRSFPTGREPVFSDFALVQRRIMEFFLGLLSKKKSFWNVKVNLVVGERMFCAIRFVFITWIDSVEVTSWSSAPNSNATAQEIVFSFPR